MSVGVQISWAKTAVWSQGLCKWSAYEMEIYVKHQFNFFPFWAFSIAASPYSWILLSVMLPPLHTNLINSFLFSLTSIVCFLLFSCAVWRRDLEKQLRDLIPSSGVNWAPGCPCEPGYPSLWDGLRATQPGRILLAQPLTAGGGDKWT